MIVNGKKTAWEAGLTVESLLKAGNYRTDRVAVEKNGEIVPKSSYEDTRICQGDCLEIVSFVGGG